MSRFKDEERLVEGSSKRERSGRPQAGGVDRVLAARGGLLVALGGWARVERPWYANRTP